MYYIIETQYNDGVGQTITTTAQARNEAQSEYYRILQFAAISNVQIHGALVIDEKCMPIMYNSYDRREEEEK